MGGRKIPDCPEPRPEEGPKRVQVRSVSIPPTAAVSQYDEAARRLLLHFAVARANGRGAVEGAAFQPGIVLPSIGHV
jgi:hypothetical protein